MLYPFKELHLENQDIELSFNIELFNSIIDVGEIWCPIDMSISYNEWITRITKQLLETLQGFCISLMYIAENKVKIYYLFLLYLYIFSLILIILI